MSKEVEKMPKKWHGRAKLRKRKGGRGKERVRRTVRIKLFSEEEIKRLTSR